MARDEGGLSGIGRNGALQGFLSPRQGFWRAVRPYIRASASQAIGKRMRHRNMQDENDEKDASD